MTTEIQIGITGTGSYVPARAFTNEDLAAVLGTKADAIYRVTGIRERRLRDERENIYIMGAVAGRRALEDAGLTPADVDAVYCSINLTGELSIPTSASIIHRLMGFPALRRSDGTAAPNYCPSCDVLAGCSGPLYALEAAYGKILAERALRGKRGTKALVIAGDAMSNYVDWHDRETAMVFADGIGAVVLEDLDAASHRDGGLVVDENRPAGILALHLASDGDKADTICLFSTNQAQSPDAAAPSPALVSREYARMKGAEVYRQAVRRLKSSLREALDRAGLREADVDMFIPHQANLLILRKVFGDLIPPDPDPDADARVYVRGVMLEGNCSAGTMFVALDKLSRSGRLKPAMTLAMPTFGAGMAWGTLVVRWHKPARAREDWAVFEARQRAADGPLVEEFHARYVAMIEKMRTTTSLVGKVDE